MPANIVTNSIITGAHANTYINFVPSAGVDRLFLVAISGEATGLTVADYFADVVAMRGQTAVEIDRAFVDAGTARGIQLFAFNESQVAAILSAGTGEMTFDGAALNATYHPQVVVLTLENTNQTLPTSFKVQGLNTAGTPTPDALPHQLTVTGALTNQLVMFFAHTSQGSLNTWSGATEVFDLNNSTSFATSIATHLATVDGSVTAGISPDGGISYATSIIGLAFSDAAAVVNSDPTLATPISDISVPANTTGTIADISANFTDADSDPLTYSVTPALPAGMTLNTTTGVISGNGTITETAAVNYTFSASDGGGGTPASDVVSIAVTAAVAANPGLTFDCFNADVNGNPALVSETLSRVRLFSADGANDVANLINVVVDAAGVARIDSDVIGAIGTTGIAVAWRTGGAVSEPFTYTVTDIGA